jgi:coenzyme F420-reducing hydrogenase gamma subunit
MTISEKPKMAVYKFTSCDGCQLAFLNAGEAFLELSELVDIVHFAEAGPLEFSTHIDIAFVEGSVSTPEEQKQIKKIRENSRYIVTIGACATAGGIQALRNFIDHQEWLKSVYAKPEYIKTLSTSTAISKNVKVDLELWGCPVNTHQVFHAIRMLLFGVKPAIKRDSICMECKRKGNVCVMVAKKQPCMGPVTQTGCGALCPGVGRACYACYGPKENINSTSLGRWFEGIGLTPDEIARQFLHINNQAEPFKEAAQYFKDIKIVTKSGDL